MRVRAETFDSPKVRVEILLSGPEAFELRDWLLNRSLQSAGVYVISDGVKVRAGAASGELPERLRSKLLDALGSL